VYYYPMGRPKNSVASVKVTITATPRLKVYLEDLVNEEGYGSSTSEVARTLVWRGIEDLIHKGVIDRRRNSENTGGNE
jgi:hypothetical protein